MPATAEATARPRAEEETVKRPIDESDKDIIESWYIEARDCKTPQEVAALVEHLGSGYVHSYGTICHAVAACAIAGATAMDRGPSGGITGFQASAVMWQFVSKWLQEDGPLRLVKYDDMLYPQYEPKFEKTISQNVADHLRKRARELLADFSGHPDVRAHLEKVAEGEIPFGYTVAGE